MFLSCQQSSQAALRQNCPEMRCYGTARAQATAGHSSGPAPAQHCADQVLLLITTLASANRSQQSLSLLWGVLGDRRPFFPNFRTAEELRAPARQGSFVTYTLGAMPRWPPVAISAYTTAFLHIPQLSDNQVHCDAGHWRHCCQSFPTYQQHSMASPLASRTTRLQGRWVMQRQEHIGTLLRWAGPADCKLLSRCAAAHASHVNCLRRPSREHAGACTHSTSLPEDLHKAGKCSRALGDACLCKHACYLASAGSCVHAAAICSTHRASLQAACRRLHASCKLPRGCA